MKRIILLSLLLLSGVLANAQKGKKDKLSNKDLQDLNILQTIEDIIENAGEEADFDLNTLQENLDHYANKPLDLNRASKEELTDLGLLTDPQVEALVRHRAETGTLLSIYELQIVPLFDQATIDRILPFVKVMKSSETYNVPFFEMMSQGSNQIYMRYERILEEKKGYTETEDTTASRYLGNPDKYYFRFRHQYENRLSYGITAEKDPGEDFFRGSNKQGFDYYSAHFFAKDISNFVKGIAIGDFQARFGQGLVLASGLGSSKSSNALGIKSSGRILKQYTSVNESLFFRGLAGTMAFGENIEATVFGSYRNRDANLVSSADSVIIDEEVVSIASSNVSSLQASGLHRTNSEVEDEGAIQQTNLGANVKYTNKAFSIGVNALYTKLSEELIRNPQPYNQFYFNGNQLLNVSTDYSLVYKNMNFFGETAISDNGGIATVNGLLLGLDKIVDLAVLHRYYQKDYQALFHRPFGESSTGNNETGLYLGFQVKPNRKWNFNAYFDTWQHPWLRSNTSGPAKGVDYLMQLTHRPKRGTNIYLRFKDEIKDLSITDGEKIKGMTDSRKTQIRFHIGHKIQKVVELRNRIEFVRYEEADQISRGFMAYQDVIVKPIGSPLSGNLRFAVFKTDDYDSRLYAFENDLLYSFSIPAYYYTGTRFYINLRYRPISLLTMELRFAQTFVKDRDSFGSGLEEIQGNTRSQVKAQIRLKF